MARTSKAELRLQMVDAAAEVIARVGVEHASLQQIADALGYSKAGLLHHFPSKVALVAAAVEATRDQAEALLAGVEHLEPGPARDYAVVEASVDSALSRPGLTALGFSFITGDRAIDPAVAEVGEVMLRALAVDLETADEQRVARIVSAAAALTVAALVARRAGRSREWRATIVESAFAALGHVSPSA